VRGLVKAYRNRRVVDGLDLDVAQGQIVGLIGANGAGKTTTQGLDPAGRRGVWAAIDELRGAGTTVLLVTHELDEAEELCDRVVAMRSGRVIDSGTPAELVDRHGRAATITFTLPAGLQPEALEALPSVTGVALHARKATVMQLT
jgi:ABC-2 type transport system ATP-binding protein